MTITHDPNEEPTKPIEEVKVEERKPSCDCHNVDSCKGC